LLLIRTKSRKVSEGAWVNTWVVLVMDVSRRRENAKDRRECRVGTFSRVDGKGAEEATGSLESIAEKSRAASSSAVAASGIGDIVGGGGDVGNSEPQ
jgi:hypothetical protein